MSIEWLKDWEANLASTGQLAVERQVYKEELIRLGESEADAAAASESYVPDPKMIGQAVDAARQRQAIKSQVGAIYGDPVFTLPPVN